MYIWLLLPGKETGSKEEGRKQGGWVAECLWFGWWWNGASIYTGNLNYILGTWITLTGSRRSYVFYTYLCCCSSSSASERNQETVTTPQVASFMKHSLTSSPTDALEKNDLFLLLCTYFMSNICYIILYSPLIPLAYISSFLGWDSVFLLKLIFLGRK